MVAVDDWHVDDAAAPWCAGRRRSPTLPRSRATTPCSTCSPAATRRDAFAELRPRIVLGPGRPASSPRGPGAQRLAVTCGGTIPDRGLFGVFLVGDEAARAGRRARRGDGLRVPRRRRLRPRPTSWRIEDITHDRVLVTPAPGQPGRLPFWKGDALGRPVELGRARRRVRPRGRRARARRRAARGSRGRAGRVGRRQPASPTSPSSARPTGHVPDDRTIVVERFRDELGDWRVVRALPVRRPGARAVGAGARRPGCASATAWTCQAMHADDGIVLRLPDDRPRTPPGADDRRLRRPTRSSARHRRGRRLGAVRRPGSASAPPARCCCRAATPAGARRCGSSASAPRQLLAGGARVPSFPIVLETMRECLQDVFDVPGAGRS